MTSHDNSSMYNHRELLSHLHRGGEWAYWFVLPGGRSFWWKAETPGRAPKGKNVNVYFGVHPTAKQRGQYKRARVEDVMLINCLFADFDIKDFGGSHEKTLTHINSLLEPSVTVSTGGGYHCYWLLESSFHLSTEEDRKRAISLQRRWVDFVGSDPGAKDLARVLRVPGSYNYKPEYGPDFPRATILGPSYDRRYTLEQLERELPPVEPAQGAGSSVQGSKTSIISPPVGGDDPYAQAALSDELAVLASTREGNRNNQLNTSAFNLGQFVGAGRLARSYVEEQLRAVGRSVGLGEREIERTIRSGLEAGESEPRWPEKPVREPEPDQPDDDAQKERSTWPYAIIDGRLVRSKEERDRTAWEIKHIPLADFTAVITEEIVIEGGESLYHLKGTAIRGGDFELEIPAEEFSSGSKLKAHLEAAAGPLDPVHAYQARYLSAAIKTLTGDVTRTKLYDRTGWVGDRFLLPGREPDNVIIELPTGLPYRTGPTADLEQGLEGLEALINAMGPQRTVPILSFLFEAPLAKLAGWRNERYCLFVSGRTGSLKTSFAQAALSIYGPDFTRDHLLTKWGEGATRNAMMAIATHLHDVPFLIDNFKPSTGRGTDDFVNLIHNILEGGEKKRLNRAAHLKETKPTFCWPLVTGEDVPDKDPATLARILVVFFPWQDGKANDELARAQDLNEHLPAVGAAWLDWLETEEGKAAAIEAQQSFQEQRNRWAACLRGLNSNMVNVLRVASNLASNQLTWQVVEKHPQIGEVAKMYRNDLLQGLAAVGRTLSTQTAEALEGVKYLQALRALLASGRCTLLENRSKAPDHLDVHTQTCLGWKDGNGGAYLIFEVARKEVEQLLGSGALGDLSNSALYAQLDALGMIASRNPGRHTKVIAVANSRVRTLHLAPQALRESAPTSD